MSDPSSNESTYLVFRVFFASTFGDFIEERRVLHERVFPAVRKYCLDRGVRFLPIDLRYGISEAAIVEQNLIRTCLEEVARCREISPDFNFVALLGDRYGTRALAESIPEDDFEALKPFLSPKHRARVQKWYRLDKNTVPATYILQPRGRDWAANWEQLRDAFVQAGQKAGLASEKLHALNASITDQEIHAGLFSGTQPASPVLIRRTLTNGASQSSRTGRAFIESTKLGNPGPELRKTLHKKLENNFGTSFTEYQATLEKGCISEASLAAFCQMMISILETRVDQEIQAKGTQPPPKPTETDFAKKQLEHYQEQTDGLQAIDKYLADSNPIPLIITGETGIGKTTLLLKAAEKAQVTFPTAIQLGYFIGGSTSVATTAALLSRIESDIKEQYATEIKAKYTKPDEFLVPQDRAQMEVFLLECLDLATATTPLIIFIDALDQLQHDGALTRWIPDRLPDHVHLIISILPGNDCETLTQRLGNPPFDLEGLPPAKTTMLFEGWLRDYHRTLTPQQKAAVLASYQTSPANPLALRVLVEFARCWPSWLEQPPNLPLNTPDLIDLWLKDLEKPERHGAILPRYLLGLIGSGRNGLAEDELIGVVDQQIALHQLAALVRPTTAWPATSLFPTVLWARLYAEITWMCTEHQVDNTHVLNFYHRQFREAIQRRYLDEAFRFTPPQPSFLNRIFSKPVSTPFMTSPQSYHRDLAYYFSRDTGGQKPYRDPSAEYPRPRVNERMVKELAFHYAKSDQMDKLKTLVFDGEFLQAHIQAAKTSEALVDLGYLPQDTDVALLRDVLDLSQPILDDELAQELPNQIWGRSEALFQHMHPWAQWEEPHLQLQSHTLIQPVTEGQSREHHLNKVKSAIFILDGTRILSTSEDRTLCLWDVETGRFLKSLKGHSGPVRTCAFDPIHKLIASGSDDLTVRLWDSEGTLLHTFADHSAGVLWVRFSPDGRLLATGAANGAIRIWDVASRTLVHHFTEHTRAVNQGVFSSDGNLLASASNDRTVKVWDVAEGAAFAGPALHTLQGHTNAVTTCLFTLNDQHVISASADTTLRIWDFRAGTSIALAGPSTAVNACALNPVDPNILLSGSDDGTLIIWDIALKTAKQDLPVKYGDIRICAFSWDGQTALGATWGNKLISWQWDDPVPRTHKTFDEPGYGLNSCEISPDGGLIIAASEDKRIYVWETSSGKLIHVLGVPGGIQRAVAVSRDGKFVVRGFNTGLMILEDTSTHQPIYSWQAHAKCVRGCAFSPDGRSILSASEDRRLLHWQRGTDQCEVFIDPALPTAHEREIRYCTFSPDGRFVLSAGGSGSGDCTIRLWERASHSLLMKFVGHTNLVIECCFSPDSKTLYSAAFDNTINMWDIASGEGLATFDLANCKTFRPTPGKSDIRTCDIDAEGKRLIIGRNSKVITILTIKGRTLTELHSFMAHDDLVNTCRFTQDGRHIFSCSTDGSLKCWNLEASLKSEHPEPVFIWRGDRRTLVCMAYHAPSQRLFVAEDDVLHTLAIKNLPTFEAPQQEE